MQMFFNINKLLQTPKQHGFSLLQCPSVKVAHILYIPPLHNEYHNNSYPLYRHISVLLQYIYFSNIYKYFLLKFEIII